MDGADAKMQARVRLANDTANRDVGVGAISLIDRDGKVAAQTIVKQALAANAVESRR
jgi:beta-galactosidase